jgi:exopolysaccharide biosynthesis polyprenyl glycosylphosphotransferase
MGYLPNPSTTTESCESATVLQLLCSDMFHATVSIFIDMVALIVSRTVALLVTRYWLGITPQRLDTFPYTLLFALFVAVIMLAFDGYRSGEFRRPELELERVFKALLVAFSTMLSVEVLLLHDIPQSRYATVLWYVFALILVLTGRFCLRVFYAQLRRVGHARKRSVLIGTPSGLKSFEQHMAIQRHHGYEILAALPVVIDSQHGSAHISGLSGREAVECWSETVRSVKAEVVVVNLDAWPTSNLHVIDIVHTCKKIGIKVELYSSLFHASEFGFDIDNGSGCLRIRTRRDWYVQLQFACKAIIDILIGLVGSVVVLLIAPFIWMLLKLEDGGSLFYHSEYLGCDGKVHYYLKFRTMVEGADTILKNNPELQQRFAVKQKLKDDPRILKCGRLLRQFSIDEFPQFLNILKGELTFVGPRTIRLSEAERYGSFLTRRLSKKPGLTGYWQVMGRQTTTYEERILMDMYYVDNWSIWLDIVIIGKTISMFLSQVGAY